MVKCNNVSHVKTLVNLTEIFGAAGNKIPITTSVLASPGAKGIIRKVPLTLCENEILESLKFQKVRYVKRFQFKTKDSENTNEMQNSTTVFSPVLICQKKLILATCFLKYRFIYRSHYDALNAIASVM